MSGYSRKDLTCITFDCPLRHYQPCVCYREIKDKEDTLKLQRDIDRLRNWARKWGMRFQPVKCNMMQLTNKHLNKIQASYTLEGTVLENVDNIKYLGVTITNDLKWNTHISNICAKQIEHLVSWANSFLLSPKCEGSSL